MKKQLSKIFHTEPHRSILYLISLLLVRAGLQIALYRQGFVSVAADEFARGIRAAKWAEHPSIDILVDVQGTWLPIEKYINGLLLLIWPDVILAPRLTVFIASALLLITIYLLTYYLFDHFAIAVLSSLFIAFFPWYVWLSGTPMLEMYYFTCFFAGVLFLMIWLREGRKRYWLWAGLCFLLASGLHVQSWTFINLVNLLTLPHLYKFFRRKEYGNVSRLIAFYILGNGLIICFTLIEFLQTGTVFAFLSSHTSYSKWFYNGYDVSILKKLLYYPKLIIHHSSAVIWVNLGIALFFLRREQDRLWKLSPLIFAMLALLLNSVLNVFSGPPSAAPPRYSLFYVIILSFYMAYSTYYLFMLGWKQSHSFTKYPPIVLSIFLFMYGLWWGGTRIFDYPQGMSMDSVKIGSELNLLLDERLGIYMIELRYWDYLAVNLTSHYYDEMVFDREQNFRDRHTPSIFLQESSAICSDLLTANIQYIILNDGELKANAEQLDILYPYKDIGDWTIYIVAPKSNHVNDVCQ